jgi:probable F420-dependent oxidoreductase
VARPRISLLVSGLSRIFGNDLGRVLELARIADDAGIDQIALPDHVAMGPHVERYPYGRYPLPLEEPYLEPLTTLAAMAGATTRLRLGTGVLIAPLRQPVVLAKTLATLDVVSGGRVDLGVGVGWQREEFEACGVPFEERWSRLDDGLRACRALWLSEAPASFSSASVSFEALWSLPRPLQPDGIPIWFGVAPSQRNARRIAELGVGWMPMPLPAEELAAGAERIRAAFVAAGRDPDELQVRANARPVTGADGRPDLEATLAGIPELAEAGASSVSFPLGYFARRFEDVAPLLERLGKAGS